MDRNDLIGNPVEEWLGADSDVESRPASSLFVEEGSVSSPSETDWDNDKMLSGVLDASDSKESEHESARGEAIVALNGPYEDEAESGEHVGQDNDAVRYDAAPYPATPYFVAMNGSYNDLLAWMFPGRVMRFEADDSRSEIGSTNRQSTTKQVREPASSNDASVHTPSIGPDRHWHDGNAVEDVGMDGGHQSA